MASSCPADSGSVNGHESDEDTNSSIVTAHNGSTASEMTADKYGFLGGSQYTHPDAESFVPVHVLRRRELKWRDMLENWDFYMSKKYKKVRERCRKGVPPSMRQRAWLNLSGANYLMERYKYKFLELDRNPGEPRFIEDIKKDLHRQFPFHEMFADRQGFGQADLYRILKAYSVFNPVVGYCQAQAPIAAVLLMHMPAEHAFWCLVAICERYLPGYYSPGLEAVQLDGNIVFNLLKKVSSSSYKHLKKQNVEPVLYMTEWFMCAFSRTFPWATVLRVWDMFLCEGVKVLFRVALVLLKETLGKSNISKECPSMYETVELLRNLPPEILQEDFLVAKSVHLPLNDYDMEMEHQKQIAKRHSAREKQLMENK